MAETAVPARSKARRKKAIRRSGLLQRPYDVAGNLYRRTNSSAPWVSTRAAGHRHEAFPWLQPSGILNEPAEILDCVWLGLSQSGIGRLRAILLQSQDRSRDFPSLKSRVCRRVGPVKLMSVSEKLRT